jgi:hypothetical protein
MSPRHVPLSPFAGMRHAILVTQLKTLQVRAEISA